MRVLLVQKMAGVAGSETYYLNLLPALVKRGVKAAFLIVEHSRDAQRNDEFAAKLSRAGVTVIRRFVRRDVSLRLIRDLAAVVREGEYDVVQSNLIHADVWLALVKRLFLPNMRLVSTKHGYSDHYQRRHGLDPRFIRYDRMSLTTRFAGARADRVVTISMALADFFGDAGLIDQAKIAVIPYGFSFEEAESRLAPGEARFGTPQVVTVGRLVAVKQHDVLIRAFAEVLKSHPQAKLVVVGGGPEEASLKDLASKLGIPGAIEWTGYVANPHDYLRDSDLFVMASAAEGFGAVILEAWHNRLPVIAFDVPALNEVVTDGIDGILVPPFDEQELQARMRELLTDGTRRRRLAEAGRRTHRNRYTIDVMTSATLELYRDVIANQPNAPA